ncbi:MAG: biotin--[acetyl-CoA-carboxylase] ligase [Clostridiales bacterium]|nr:biotin--[acetyl-CoA-carboxylase] ligase [Clostridiales bacterium]
MSILPAHWTPLLSTHALGRAINHYEHTLTSTNTVLKELARQGAPHGSLCLCECQTAGRGRLDRVWASPEGQGIWMSVLLRPALRAEDAPLITFACALAMAQAIKEVTALDARIKWPNDLVLQGRKLCGILLEMGFDAQGLFVVAGTGLNIRRGAYPPELSDRATSLEEHATLPDRGEIIAAYLRALEDAVAAIEAEGFAGIAPLYRARSVTLGSRVHVSGAVDLTGTAEDINSSGALLVRTEDGTLHSVMAGDVSVRGVMGYV